MYSLSDYDYELPAGLIAQQPATQRDQSSLLYLNRESGDLSHHRFDSLSHFLGRNDVLVINDTAVIPGRLYGKKETGGRVEVLISGFAGGLKRGTGAGKFVCDCLVNASKRPKPGTVFYFEQGLKGKVVASGNGTHTVEFTADEDFEALLDRIGEVPLPPYIQRKTGSDPPCDDRDLYQTVYASQKGAIAAPTAGLHFTKALLDQLKSVGVRTATITLHVGYGTFLPVRGTDIRQHRMHSEQFTISESAAELINSARRNGNRIVAVGTTCVRTLEYASAADGMISPGNGNCDLFIYPGYRFKVVNAMITNFHLPKSTLLMLVSAFAGRENVLAAYAEAIRRKYRFYSYGDSMFIT